jgi:hypothetical protein
MDYFNNFMIYNTKNNYKIGTDGEEMSMDEIIDLVYDNLSDLDQKQIRNIKMEFYPFDKMPRVTDLLLYINNKENEERIIQENYNDELVNKVLNCKDYNKLKKIEMEIETEPPSYECIFEIDGNDYSYCLDPEDIYNLFDGNYQLIQDNLGKNIKKVVEEEMNFYQQ